MATSTLSFPAPSHDDINAASVSDTTASDTVAAHTAVDFVMGDSDMDLLDVVSDMPDFDALSDTASDPESLSASFVNVFGECDPFGLIDPTPLSTTLVTATATTTASPTLTTLTTGSPTITTDTPLPLFGLEHGPTHPTTTSPAPARTCSSRSAAMVMDAAVDQMLREATATMRSSSPRKSVVAIEDVLTTHGLRAPLGRPPSSTEVPLVRSLFTPPWQQQHGRSDSVGPSTSPYSVGSESDMTSTSPPMSPAFSPSEAERRQRLKGASTNPRHAAGRNHVCVQCHSRFLCKSKLDRHMLTHSGVKPFPCFCGKRFNQKSALKNHTRRHLKKKNTPRDINVEEKGLNGFSYLALTQQ